ncbi:ribonuclease T2 [Malassezia nana]|uniref:ribonuclease T2 n=1 Tax=Malassezia nana TaxID=180528 RepID=A0AAF0J897_9BASI|nr:ribonuclease T2 [Malassezia nana]
MVSAKVFVAALSTAVLAQAALYSNTTKFNHTCAIKPAVRSCSLAALDLASLDTCCTETYGGQLLATQFWDTYTGRENDSQLLPQKHWTLHGLWPDYCNGSYPQYCDLDRQYDRNPPDEANGQDLKPWTGHGVDRFIKDWDRYDLLDWMNKYWVSQGQPSADFWAHEFSKHATCFSTFDIPCYGPKYQPHQEMIDFFDTAISFYRRLPTYDWLAAEGITPSNKTRYSLKDITAALKKHYGAVPYVGCYGDKYGDVPGSKNTSDHGSTILSEVWYFSYANGRPQDLNVTHIDSTAPTSCAESDEAIWYYERTPSSERSLSEK